MKKLPFKHIIVVPATEETASDRTFMEQLVRQMSQYQGMSYLLANPNPCNTRTSETTNHLMGALIGDSQLTPSISHFPYDCPEEGSSSCQLRELAKEHILAILRMNLDGYDVLTIVTEPRFAGIMPEIILIDFLKGDGIIAGVEMIIEAGGAATVDCVTRNRNVLHPMGTQAWVAQAVLNGRTLRPAT